MSRVQCFFAAILPSSLMTAMENESRHWIIRCQACGDSCSVWQAGGIRYRASGNKWIFAAAATAGVSVATHPAPNHG